ncbi:GNAT family N-acetyltransferase [Rhodobacteraceae bacterium HSP-20]|uniref:GNAT family N-acetyltransferase n=1 Tax=Paragemmobacter amnigenus TaxID=2852097 RepID=A0ABS6J1G9_9RHOB|nr:GNAT family N-acetyltransferase [Rhodobacter amnigenus]MBU9697595.1 GNAT family N-acetyltransferase [Rhodobacter amnigenus]MBV4388822.1 GNAT family N-acetyltransferase [Rhodobacter amnigenus]
MKTDLLENLAAIPAADWDALACPESADGSRPVDPFTTHRFLAALETSRSTGTGTGWQARPLMIRDDHRPLAVAPLYVKTHSQGEYIFDHGWAQAYERAGGRYYPKLQIAVPFTPATGRRLLAAPDAPHARDALIESAIGLAHGNQLSSLHITFCTGDEAETLSARHGLLHRVTQQFHWENRGYATFGDFLSDLSSRKRKMIRKERETARAAGLTIRHLTGDAIEPRHWDAFWTFYQDTGARKWGTPYLTRRFFTEAHATMRRDMLLVLAERPDGTPVAGALNFIGRDTLFGRYWGCTEDHPCLHFELCYYQAIDWAIAHRLPRVEAGAQGEHKLARGYLPTPVHSLHYITDPGLRDAVARYLQAERRAVDEEIEVLTAYGPFRRVTAED